MTHSYSKAFVDDGLDSHACKESEEEDVLVKGAKSKEPVKVLVLEDGQRGSGP